MSRPKKKTIKKVISNKAEKNKEFKVKRLLGMKDYIGTNGKVFSLVYNKAFELAQAYGFSPVKTPILENFDLFKKSTRLNNDKDFYFVDDEKFKKTILRPELTQGILRSYIESQLNETVKIAHFYSLGSIFRKEKLQTGHYKESTQFDLEIIGEKKAMAEVLLISIAHHFFKELGIDIQVQINSLGDLECQKEYAVKLIEYYKERGRRANLCVECKKNLAKNPISLLDCKDSSCIKERTEAPQIVDSLSDDSKNYFTKVLEYLDELNINYNFNPYLVRGLDYYTETVFEIWPVNKDGSVVNKFALGGGGRYDNLLDKLGGPELPAVGLALGIERIVNRLKDKSQIQVEPDDIIFIAQLSDVAKVNALNLFEELRSLEYDVRQSVSTDSLKTQVEEAHRLGAKLVLILGKKEVMDGTIIMRDMESSAQEVIAFKKIKDRLKKIKNINRKRGGLYG